MEKRIKLGVREVLLGWNGDPSEIRLRVSILGHIGILTTENTAEINGVVITPQLQFHFLVQSKNLAIASFTTTFAGLSNGSSESFSKAFQLNASENVLKLLGLSGSESIKLSLKITGEVLDMEKEKIEGDENKIIEMFEKKDSEDMEYSNDSIEKNKESEESKNEEVVDVCKSLDLQIKGLNQNSLLEPENDFEKNTKSVTESPECIRNRQSISLDLSKDSDSPVCPYVKRISRCQFLEQFVDSTLAGIKSDLGSKFQKLVATPVKVQPAKAKSPGQKRIPNNKSLNSSIQSDFQNISFISTMKNDESLIEIPSNFDLNIENLTVKRPDLLKCSIISLLAKLTQYEVESEEISIASEFILKQDQGIIEIQNELMKNQESFKETLKDSNEFVKDLQNKILEKRKTLGKAKEKRKKIDEELEWKRQELDRLKKENLTLKKEWNYYEMFEGVRGVAKEIEDVERRKEEIESSFEEGSKEFKDFSAKNRIEQLKVLSEKQDFYEKTKKFYLEEGLLLKENAFLTRQIAKLSEFSWISSYTADLTSTISNVTSFINNEIQSISLLFQILISDFSEQSSLSSNLQKKLISSIKNYQETLSLLSQAQSSSADFFSNTSSETNSRILSIQTLQNLLEKINTLDADISPISSRIECAREMDDQLTSEVSYFSDFVFSFSRNCLQQYRMIFQIQTIDERKDYDVQIARESIAHMKLKNPVYKFVKGDDIDKALANYLNSRNAVLPLPFIRETEGIYFYGTKKITISVERQKLTIKVGGGYMFIDEFIEKHTQSELEKYEKRKDGLSPRTKKLMGKWVGGIIGMITSPKEKMKEIIQAHVREHRYSSAYAVRGFSSNNSPLKRSPHTDYVDEERSDTPVIGDDD